MNLILVNDFFFRILKWRYVSTICTQMFGHYSEVVGEPVQTWQSVPIGHLDGSSRALASCQIAGSET